MSEVPRQIWDDASVGEYALGVMPHAERLRFAADLKNDRALQLRLIAWEENFTPMTSDIPEIAPPQHLLNKIEQRLFPAAKPVSLFQRLGFWQAATALGFGTLAVVLALPRMAPPPGESAPLVAVLQGENLLVSARYDAATGTLAISRKKGDAATARDFELWVIAGGNAPISLGVLPDAETAMIKVPDQLKAAISGSTLAISDEPDGGSTTGAPTGAVLAAAAIIEI